MKAISKIIATICLATFSLSVNAQEVKKPTQREPIKRISATPAKPVSRNTQPAAKQVKQQRPERRIISTEKQMLKVDPSKE